MKFGHVTVVHHQQFIDLFNLINICVSQFVSLFTAEFINNELNWVKICSNNFVIKH